VMPAAPEPGGPPRPAAETTGLDEVPAATT
jgi:hypothetical protein